MASSGAPAGNEVRPQPATQPVGYQYVFLSIIAAIVVAFVLFPGAALGVFYPPCTYSFPGLALTPTVAPGGAGQVPTPTATETATPTPTPTPPPAPTATPGNGPAQPSGAGTPAPAPTLLSATSLTATAEARQIVAMGRLALQDDTANYAQYAHCLAGFNGFIDYTVKFLAIFAAVITTISATQGWREIGFTSGALVTALTAFQTTFPMDARATFYQSVATQIDSVVAQVRYSVIDDQQQLLQLRSSFDQIKVSAAAGPVVRAVATQNPTPSVVASVTVPAASPTAPATPTQTATSTPAATATPTSAAPSVTTATPAPP